MQNLVIILFTIIYSSASSSNLIAQDLATQERLDWSDNSINSSPVKTIDSLLVYYRTLRNDNKLFDAALVLNKIIYHSYFKLGNVEQGLIYIEELGRLSEISSDDRIPILYHENKGMLFYESDLDKSLAFKHFEIAYKLAKSNEEQFRMEYIANNYGLVLNGQKNYEQAITIYSKALEIASKKNNIQQSATIYANLGVLYLLQDNFEQAENHFQNALQEAYKTNLKGIISSRASYLGAFYIDINQLDSAQKYLEIAEHFIHGLRLNQDKAFVYRKLIQLNKLYNNSENLVNYYQLLTAQNDSIRKSILIQTIYEFEYKLSLTQLEAEKALEINKLKKDKQITTLIIVLIIISSVSIIIFLIYIYTKLKSKAEINRLNEYNARIEKEKIKLDKEILDRQITAKSLFLLEKENLITKITVELSKLRKELEKKNVSHSIQNIISEIKTSSNTSAQEEFESRFKDVHPNFYKNLSEKHSDLTTNEKKLATFLVMDLNTKEIASITGQSPNTIKVARTRLRKKLQLSNSGVKINSYLNGFI